MPRSYNEPLAQCPFFIASSTKGITCEGITDDCKLKLVFIDKDKLSMQRGIFCDARYQNCEVYQMLVKKYEE